ncbi:MAG: helix-turn-helix domain-containing protein [Candidatus Xenobia bacterium]
MNKKTIQNHLSITEFAAAIGRSEPTVRRYIREGKIQAVPHGRSRRIPRGELKHFDATLPPAESEASLWRVIFIEVAHFLMSHAVELVLG